MQGYKYPRFVDKKNIEMTQDTESERIFKMSIPLNFEGDKSVLVVTRAPSVSIAYKVLKYVESKKYEEFIGVNRVEIVFLFPVIEYDEYYLEEKLIGNGEKFLFGDDGFYDEQGSRVKNDELIFYSMMEANYIVFAWGDIPSSISDVGNERVRYILKGYKMIKNNCVDVKETYKIGSCRGTSPKHCMTWRKNDGVFRFDV
ncbi:MAG: hypothetical protein ACRCWG_14630 [Sarcina sp.]